MKRNNELSLSKYFSKHKRYLLCPFCGSQMRFAFLLGHDSSDRFWICDECGLTITDKEDYTKEELKLRRILYKKRLKKELQAFRARVEDLSRRLAAWGKYMSDRAKVELLGEALDGEERSPD